MNIEEQKEKLKNEKDGTSSSGESNSSTVENILIAAKKGDVEAQYQMGELYYEGLEGYELDDEKAFEWYLKAAEQGHIYAQLKAGAYYAKVKKDYKNAEKWLMESAKNKFTPDVCCELAFNCRAQGKPEESYKWYEKGASLGYQICLYWQSLSLYYGVGVEKDEERAISILLQLDPTEFIGAASLLGYYYQNNDSHRDIAKAIKFLNICAQDGLENGECGEEMYSLACIYLGESGYQNFGLARKWFANAISEGCTEAYVGLGVMHKAGVGGSRNLEKAESHFRQAAEEGSEEGMFYLASLLFETKREEEAIEWFKKSADAGFENAKIKLAELASSVNESNREDDQSYSDYLYKKLSQDEDYIIDLSPEKFIELIENIQNEAYKKNLSLFEEDKVLFLGELMSMEYYYAHFLDDDYEYFESEYLQILDGVDDFVADMNYKTEEAYYIAFTAKLFSAGRFKDTSPLNKLEEFWETLSSMKHDKEDPNWENWEVWEDMASDIYNTMKDIFTSAIKNNKSNKEAKTKLRLLSSMDLQ